MSGDIEESEVAKAWSLRCISIVNASTVADLEDSHNYRHYAADALRAFARAWLRKPYPHTVSFGRHVCNETCPMFEFKPPGKCSGDIFICWASGDIHVCTKELCRSTVPQHGFPGYNNARRAVCHVCNLTRRVFSVNPDQSIGGCGGGGGGGGGDDDGDDFATMGPMDMHCGFNGDGGRILLEYDSDGVAPDPTSPAAAAASGKRKPEPRAPVPDSDSAPSSKRKRATATSAAVAPFSMETVSKQRGKKSSLAPRLILYGDDRESRERRMKIYAGVAWQHLPDAETSKISAWVHSMERIWSVMQKSPGFKPNNSQLQPRLFALVCLNYMRDIGLTTKTLCGARVVRVLPANSYIRNHMADIKQIGEHGFTQAERALMCCMNELPTEDKLRLEFNDKVFASFYSFFFGLNRLSRVSNSAPFANAVAAAAVVVGIDSEDQFGIGFRPQYTRKVHPCIL